MKIRKSVAWVLVNTIGWGVSWMLAILAAPSILNAFTASANEANSTTSVHLFLPAIIPAVIIASSQIAFLRMKLSQGLVWLLATAGGLAVGLPIAGIAMIMAFAMGVVPRQFPTLIGNLLTYAVVFVGGGFGGIISGPIMWAAFNRRFFWRWFLGSILAWSGAMGVMISAIPAIQYRFSIFVKGSLLLTLFSFLERIPIHFSAALIGAFSGAIYGGILLLPLYLVFQEDE